MTKSGVYSTSVEIAVPPAPGAPAVSLRYDSGGGLGVAGVGWDLSVGWPTLIARDTRRGTPDWRFDSAWLWGDTPLVSTSGSCAGTAPCAYRAAPDTLAKVEIDLSTKSPTAKAVLSNGVVLQYEPVVYDGVTNPSAPAVAQTNVFGFILRSARTSNGYLTCFENEQWGDTSFGRAPVLAEITYGVGLSDCDNPPAANKLHHVAFTYVDPTSSGLDYSAPFSYRFGAPVAANNLLTRISISAVDLAPSASAPVAQQSYKLEYEPASATETRRALLDRVVEVAPGPAGLERTLRAFRYGGRKEQFDPTPQLVDVAPDTNDVPPSLSGTVTRPMRMANPFVANLLQLGADEPNAGAPASQAVTRQWSLTDVNADGLLDTLVSGETGADPSTPWPTFESSAPSQTKPPQQWAFLDNGIVSGSMGTSKVILDTSAAQMVAKYPASNGWIWQDGEGHSRESMPMSVSSPEIRDGYDCNAVATGDRRVWPYLPDGSFGGSQGGLGDSISNAAVHGAFAYNYSTQIVKSLWSGFVPRHTVSAEVSGWLDMNGDGVPDWVVTPGMVEHFSKCLGADAKPVPSDTDWYVAPGRPAIGGPTETFAAQKADGPPGPVGLPLSFSDEAGQSADFGLTIPMTEAVSAAVEYGTTGSLSAGTVGSLAAGTFAPRGDAGASISAAPTARSVTGAAFGLAENALSGGSLASGATSFVQSALGASFDITLLSGGNFGSSRSLSQVLDFNADGLPDYLLYDSVGQNGGPKGALVLYLNDGMGGFTAGRVINDGYTTPYAATVTKVLNDAKSALAHAQAAALAVPVCVTTATDPYLYTTQALVCTALDTAASAAVVDATNVAAAARPFLKASTDALPEDRKHPDEIDAMSVLFAGLLPSVYAPCWDALAGAALTCEGPATVAGTAEEVARTAELTARTVKQLAFQSLLNAPSKGSSAMDQSWIGQDTGGIAAQTGGLVDLNGDALPDYVVTTDARKTCGTDEWEVYWGIGTSSLGGVSRAFTASPTCVAVPASPADVKVHGYETMPMHVDFVLRAPKAALSDYTDDTSDTFVQLLDWNQDGRPDLLVASKDGKWDPKAKSNTWLVYLNTGRGFDVAKPLEISSLSGVASGVPLGSLKPFDPAFPAIKTGEAYDPAMGQKRSINEVNVGFVDVSGDGTADVAQRVPHDKFVVNGVDHYRAGIEYWTRAGKDPQDLLVEDRDPLAASRTMVTYLPASRFQWRDGEPDGKTPAGGHRPAVGEPEFLVRSVTTEPYLGRDTQRTRVGYDYAEPAYDAQLGVFTGFARITVAPLDPTTGNAVAAATATSTYSPQAPESNGESTRTLVADGGTGAPVSETLRSYVHLPTATGGPGSQRAIFSAPDDEISVEFPHNLTKAAILDVGFDGRSPLANRAPTGPLGVATSAAGGSAPSFDADQSTGGAMGLDGSKTQWVEFDSPHPSSGVGPLTVETWISPKATSVAETVLKHGNDYELRIDANGHAKFGVNTAGWTYVDGGTLASDRWSHVAASYDGSTMRVFVNGVKTATAAASGSIAATGKLDVGCAPNGTSWTDCFTGSIGELRIYPEAWTSPPRITRTRSAYLTTGGAGTANFGMRDTTWDYGDVSRADDDVVEKLTYATPQSSSNVQGEVATTTRRALAADGVTPGNYLGYAEHSYDSLPLGQVGAGNPTRDAAYSGPSNVSAAPTADTVTKTRYTDPACPGVATETEDPLSAVTKTTHDATCAFVLTRTNALGHAETSSYYGVDGTGYDDATTGFHGRYGEIRSAVDANGAATRTGYDDWGRATALVHPYDPPARPGEKTAYRDAQCDDGAGTTLSCFEPAAQLSAPARVTKQTWDDMQARYRVAYDFGDGQVQREVVRKGNPDWLVSGARDFDALGRVIRAYKPQYLSETQKSGATDPCPAAGTWCVVGGDPFVTHVDPLRDNVAHVQTAYDDVGRIVRAYAPDVPRCADPSAPNQSGGLACDDTATNAAPAGHFTRFEYPEPGVIRTVDARGVPSVVRHDAHGRTAVVEEWKKTGTQPYSTATYAYDRDGRLVSVTDANGNTSTATYDALGRRTASADADMGTWKYEYDAAGRLTSQRDAAGGIAKHTYDALGRVTRSEYYEPPKTYPQYRNYTFDGGPNDSDTQFPTFAYGSLLWRKASQFENQEAFWYANYTWDNVPLTPLPLTYGNKDDGVATLTLPFDVALTPNHVWADRSNNGYTVTPIPATNRFPAGQKVYVGTNGRIRFDAAGATDTSYPISPSRPRLPIAGNFQIGVWALWNDLVMDNGMSYAVVGTAPKRKLIVQWDGYFYNYSPTTYRALFRAVFFEGTGEIQLQYNTLPWFGTNDGTVGIQNHSSTLAKAAGFEAVDAWNNRIYVSSGSALTSRHDEPNHVLQFNDGSTYSKSSAVFGRASFDVDLSNATSATLSFKSSWNTRCAMVPRGQCPYDSMRVEYWAGGSAPTTTLLTQEDLTADDTLNAAVGTSTMSSAPTITAQLPQSLMGNQKVTIYFTFDTVTPDPDPRYGWFVDDIRVSKTVQKLDDVVLREYDSAELALDYADSKPLVDVTFDVPGRVEDRSPLHNVLKPTSLDPVDGQSGRAVRFDGSSSSLEVDGTKLPTASNKLTAEAWVRPTATGADQTVIARNGAFALVRNANGTVRCSVFVGGTQYDAVGTTVLPEETWTHVALTYDGADLRCYVNGAEEADTGAAASAVGSGGDVLVGDDGAGHRFHGDVDEVRLFGATRTAQRILTDARSPLRPGPPRGNVLDLTFGDPAKRGADVSGAGNDASVFAATPVPGILGTAIDLAPPGGGVGQYVQVPSSPSLQSDQVTAEAWVKTTTRENRLIVGKWHSGNPGWRVAINRKSGQVRFEVATRAVSPNIWSSWSGTTVGSPVQGNPTCGAASTSPTAKRTWVAPASGTFAFSTVGGATWDTVVFVHDASGKEIACNDDAQLGVLQSRVLVQAQQGETFDIFTSGFNGTNAGPFTMTVDGPATTFTSFVTLDSITDGRWHHVAGVYDGASLRVYIDGRRALRTCTSVEGGDALTCTPLPIDKCSTDKVTVTTGGENPQKHTYGNAVCVTGTIINSDPVFVGAYDPTSPSLEGREDEVRVSNYPKRDFEAAASARPYSAYTRVLGRETGVQNKRARDRKSYDLVGQQVTTERDTTYAPLSTGTFLSRAAYDNLGRVGSLRYPGDGEVVVSGFDRGGTQTSLVGYGDFAATGGVYGKQSYLADADVTSTGEPERLRFGNGVETSFTYDTSPTSQAAAGAFGDERLIRLTTGLPNGQTLQDESYAYDPAGNLLTRTTAASSLHPSSTTDTYTYDDLSRLATFQSTLGAGGGYTYDDLGNLLTKDGATLTYAASQHPHAVSSVTKSSTTTLYAYDANGVLASTTTGGTTTTYEHDPRLDLTRISGGPQGTLEFGYDGDGIRTHKVESTGVTTEPFPFFRVTPNATEKYYFAGDRRIARRIGKGPGGLAWYHPDHLGATIFMTDASGNELQDAYSEYWPFGAALANGPNNTGGPYAGANTPDKSVDRSGGFQFTGKELDDSGLYFFGARYYDPSIGRFIEPDTVVPDDRPQSLNRYSYVENNPLVYTDPTGHEPDFTPEERAQLREYGVDCARELCADPITVVGNPSEVGPAGGNADPGLVVARGVLGNLGFKDYAAYAPGPRPTTQLDVLAMGVFGAQMLPLAVLALPEGLAAGAVGAVDSASVSLYLRAPWLFNTLLGIGAAKTADAVIEADENLAPTAEALEERAGEIHQALDPIAQEMRTTTVVQARTATGELVNVVAAGALRDLSPAQRDLLDVGEVPAALPGADAEMTALHYITEQGWTPVALGVTRDICPICSFFIQESGGILITPRQVIWPGQ